jgi:hypothetical protein
MPSIQCLNRCVLLIGTSEGSGQKGMTFSQISGLRSGEDHRVCAANVPDPLRQRAGGYVLHQVESANEDGKVRVDEGFSATIEPKH